MNVTYLLFPLGAFQKVALKAFIKPFEVTQRSVKIKMKLIFSLCLGLGREGLNSWIMFNEKY